jgi:hypothetical protein
LIVDGFIDFKRVWPMDGLITTFGANCERTVKFFIELRSRWRECIEPMAVATGDDLLGRWMVEEKTVRVAASTDSNALEGVGGPFVLD